MNRKQVCHKATVTVLAIAIGMGFTGCSTTAATNAQSYYNSVSSVMKTMLRGNGTDKSKNNTDSSNTAMQLATPTNFAVDEMGNYSFDGVENAQYYLLYFCAPDATEDGDSFLYTSGPINANGGQTYKGACADELNYAYGEYLVKVFAFPDLTDKAYEMSSAATATYTYKGNQSAPQLSYYWNTFDGTMGVQVANMDAYEFEAYPDKVDVTFTNAENSADQVVITIDGVSPANNSAVSDQLTKGAAYNVTAVATSGNAFVQNPTSDTTEVAKELQLGDASIYEGSYSYSDGFANNIFNYPRACAKFDLANGGSAGIGGNNDFVATPAAANPGSAYSYTVQCGSRFPVAATLELKTDGTFEMAEGGWGPINASSVQGIWTENGDGTAVLSYNPASVVIN